MLEFKQSHLHERKEQIRTPLPLQLPTHSAIQHHLIHLLADETLEVTEVIVVIGMAEMIVIILSRYLLSMR